MSVTYKPVIWNRTKIIYDVIVIATVALYIEIFTRFAPKLQSGAIQIDDAILAMRAYGSCAFLLLTFILCIGPLARLDPRWLPVLYNRRHLGVITCCVAFLHLQQVLDWYFAFSPVDPWVAMLAANTTFSRLAGFPFEWFGLITLVILLVLAVTSHDFWLSYLTPPAWKFIHMLVYVGYASIVVHLALGPLITQANGALAIVAIASVSAVSGLHLMAARKTLAGEAAARTEPQTQPWHFAGWLADLAEDRGLVVPLPGGDTAAVFRYDGKLSAVSNACAHQNGPLGEGRIIDGCVTCPWHGFQYRPEDGCAPAPYTEKLATYRLKLDGERILIDPRANPPGTRVEPVLISSGGK